MPNNHLSHNPQPTPMPRGYSGGSKGRPRVTRAIDGHANYTDSYPIDDSDPDGDMIRTLQNSHEPTLTEDDLGVY